MYPKGIVYKSGWSKNGEINLHPSKLIKIGYHFARTFGAGLVSFAIVGFIFSFWPIVKEEIRYDAAPPSDIKTVKAIDLGLNPYFSIYIPKINAKADIIPNVDTGSSKSYLKALSQGVAHAKGTNFPGSGHTIYLFSHSTDSPLNFARYNAVFYLLRKLTKGDKITVYFMGKAYDYVVENEIITSADDTSWLKDDGEGERLVLQTCDPPGTSLRRLIIIARPVGVVLN